MVKNTLIFFGLFFVAPVAVPTLVDFVFRAFGM